MTIKNLVRLLLIFLITPAFASASVRINEIAWMGTDISSSDEWIELYNDSSTAVSLDGWTLSAIDGSPAITLSGSIGAGAYFLLERTDDDSVAGVPADLIYSGSLGNSGEYLVLKDSQGVEVDVVNATDGWQAGDNTTKDTMQWSGSDWITAGPTSRSANSTVDVTPEPTDETTNDTDGGTEVSSGSSMGGASISTGKPKISLLVNKQNVTVGVPVHFESNLSGVSESQMYSTDVRWSFGDGAQSSGRKSAHTFQFPGEYVVTVSLTYAGKKVMDSEIVRVVDPTLEIASAQDEPSPFVEIANRSSSDADISGWRLFSGGEQFVFPADTYIRAKKSTHFPGTITGLLYAEAEGVRLALPDGSTVSTLNTAIDEEETLAVSTNNASMEVETLASFESKLSDTEGKLVTLMNTVAGMPVSGTLAYDEETAPEEREPEMQETIAEESLLPKTQMSQTASVGNVIVVEKPKSWWKKLLGIFAWGG